MLRQRGNRVQVAALTVSAIAQVAFVVRLGSSVSGGDAQTYLRLADDWSLSVLFTPEAFEGNFWPAGYSGFLHLFSPLGEHQVLAVRLAQVAMVLIMAMMAGVWTKRYSQAAQTWTVAIVVFSPTLIWGTWAIGYELLLGFLIAMALSLAWRDQPRTITLAASGVAMGLALIVQFRALLVTVVLIVLAARIGRRHLTAFAIGFGVPVLGWALRNGIATGSFVPWSANGGWNLWNGNGPHATGHNVFPLPPIPETATSYADAAIQWITANPGGFLDLTARRLVYTFYPTQFADVTNEFPFEAWVTAAQWIYSGVVVALLVAFIGALAWRTPPRLVRMWPVFAVAAAYLSINVVFIVEPRFRIPVEAMLLATVVSTAFALMESETRQTQMVSRTHQAAETPGRAAG